MTKLRKLKPREYSRFEREIITFYAEQSAKAGRIPEKKALDWSAKDIKSDLTDGINTSNNLFYVIESNEPRELAGYVWCVPNDEREKGAFLYAILIFEKHRNRGLGTEALKLLEDKLKKEGFDSLDLHVYAFNEAAIHLYKKLGYNTSALTMGKKI